MLGGSGHRGARHEMKWETCSCWNHAQCKHTAGIIMCLLMYCALLCRSISMCIYIYTPCSGGWSWNCVKEKYCYLAGGWKLELEGYERDSL